MKKILWLFLLILPFTGIYGQKADITFLVSDSTTGRAVDSAQVTLGSVTQWTNPNGVASYCANVQVWPMYSEAIQIEFPSTAVAP